MRAICLVLGICSATALYAQTGPAKPSPAPVISPSKTEIQKHVLTKGTELQFRFAQNFNSKYAKIGDKVELVIAEEVKDADAVLIPKGTRARAIVDSLKQGSGMGKDSSLGLYLDTLKIGQQNLRLSGKHTQIAKANVGGAIAMTAAFGLSGLLLTPSRNVDIKEGTPITGKLDEDAELVAINSAPPGRN
jgi:hypothetical protein